MNVYITDCDHADINEELKIFNQNGINLIKKQVIAEDDVIKQCYDADILIIQYAQISAKVMDSIPNLKFIVRYGVGTDSIDLKAATSRYIQVGNVPDYGMNEVADHAISLMLTLERKISVMNTLTKRKKWNFNSSKPIHRFSSQTVGVVGLGRIGKNFAYKAHALGFKIIGYDPYAANDNLDSYIELVNFEKLIKNSDVISLHVPLDNNAELFSENEFQKMKNSAFIVNVARGGLIAEDDLGKALSTHQIAGAALDCMKIEPMSINSSIFAHDNLIVTPHMAWYSEEAYNELKRKVAEEVIRFINDQPIHYPINQLLHE